MKGKTQKDFNAMSKSEQALSLFKNGYNCAQAILVAFANEAGVDAEMAFSMASGLGGGVGRTQNICGAINAGAIVLGMRLGRYQPGDNDAKNDVAYLVGQFVSECRKELGSTNCHELLKIDINNLRLKKQAADSGHLAMVCNNAVSKSAEILERFLAEKPIDD
ncbi:MAG TPA: hypothetical protein DG754_03420 [Bacteroidales bacterium]|nr:hypothetical protein [Bacteroidales bacterium]